MGGWSKCATVCERVHDLTDGSKGRKESNVTETNDATNGGIHLKTFLLRSLVCALFFYGF